MLTVSTRIGWRKRAGRKEADKEKEEEGGRKKRRRVKEEEGG